jgi:hypothetical protein
MKATELQKSKQEQNNYLKSRQRENGKREGDGENTENASPQRRQRPGQRLFVRKKAKKIGDSPAKRWARINTVSARMPRRLLYYCQVEQRRHDSKSDPTIFYPSV